MIVNLQRDHEDAVTALRREKEDMRRKHEEWTTTNELELRLKQEQINKLNDQIKIQEEAKNKDSKSIMDDVEQRGKRLAEKVGEVKDNETIVGILKEIEGLNGVIKILSSKVRVLEEETTESKFVRASFVPKLVDYSY